MARRSPYECMLLYARDGYVFRVDPISVVDSEAALLICL